MVWNFSYNKKSILCCCQNPVFCLNLSSAFRLIGCCFLLIFQETFRLSIMLLLGSLEFAERFLNRHLSETRQGREADFPTSGRSAGITETTHMDVKSSCRCNNGPKLHLQWAFFLWCRANSAWNIGCND